MEKAGLTSESPIRTSGNLPHPESVLRTRVPPVSRRYRARNETIVPTGEVLARFMDLETLVMLTQERSSAARWKPITRHAIAAAAVIEALAFGAAHAQTAELPFDVGERLRYRVTVAKLGTVGEGEMSVTGPADVRGTPTLLLRSDIHARIGFFKNTQRAESWVDPTRMATLRFAKRTRGALARDEEQHVELYPDEERWQDDNGNHGQSPTNAPLDELSFIYYLRTLPLANDSVDSVVRHYDPARNPVVVKVTGRDTLRTAAGTFPTVVVEMRVKNPRRVGGDGLIRLHLSDDAFRYPVRIESSVPVLGTTVLTLESYTPAPQHLASRHE